MPKTLHVREGDTEPIELVVSGKRMVSGVLVDIEDLTDLTEAKLYMRERGADDNHVDGATLTLGSSALALVFDPTGNGPSGINAFGSGSAGTYDGYILMTWNDGDTTRHPGDNDRGGRPDLHVVVSANYE